MSNFINYWEKRYGNEGKIWGDQPSKSAKIALKYFKSREIKSILVPGAGYGRNTKLFSENGYIVVGIEISSKAIQIARKFDKKSKFIELSVLDLESSGILYEAIYCFNTLHLFLEKQREKFLNNCFRLLKDRGYVFFVVFSEEEKSFGKGRQIEKNTFESKPGRPTHYFTEKDLIAHFKDFTVIETGIIVDRENHGEVGIHDHILRYIFAQKKK